MKKLAIALMMRPRVFVILGLTILVTLTTFPGPVQAATLTVTKADDTFDGVCDADCSLREAIFLADPGDSIIIPAGEFTLSLGSQITIDQDVTMIGAGAQNTIIQANADPGVATFRVLRITGGEVTISGVTIRHGKLSGVGGLGGGISNSGILTLVESVVSDNIVNGCCGGFGDGGGITSNGTLTLIDSAVRGNSSNRGGGIKGELTLIRSTVSGNSASHHGGGIFGSGTFINSTISNNSITGGQSGRGGAGLITTGNTTLTNMTITENSSSGSAGGIWRSLGTMELINTLVAKNTALNGPDCAGSITTLGHNFIGTLAGCDIVPEPSDVTGTVDVALDPRIGPLQGNGGATETHSLLQGSLAIDAGDDGDAPATDQRGIPRPQGSASDIGAFELEAPTFSCASVSEIPPAECEALTALFDSTDGPNWTNNSGWLETETPCSWLGVVCGANHVTQLDVSANELNGSVPAEVGNLPNLAYLRLNGNQLLNGPLPQNLTNLNLVEFFFDDTDLCEPPDAAFQAWLTGIGNLQSTGVICGGIPFGDCNGDGFVSSADTTAVVLEIFDGDGDDPADASNGTFVGTAGCDANEDGTISAADITCVVLIIFNGPGSCGASGLTK